MMVPLPPTVANCVPDQVTPKNELITENVAIDVTVPPGAVTLSGPVKLAMDGIVMVICVLDAMVTRAVTLLIVTVLLLAKLVPVIVTAVPGGPLVGAMLVIVGGDVGVGPGPGPGASAVGELSQD
jgi:hypothetical protein